MTNPYMNFVKEASKPVPQTKAVSELQVQNNAGGYTFQVSDKSKLERFLILGTVGGTYYVNEDKLTTNNVEWLINLIKENNPDTIKMIADTIIDVSVNGRAYKNTPAIFAAAIFMTYYVGEVAMVPEGKKQQSVPNKKLAREVAFKVCRTATHLYEFVTYAKGMRGWGRSFKTFVQEWFTAKPVEALAYQAIKYRSRTVAGNTWTQRDLMRLAHPVGVDHRTGEFILGKEPDFKKFATPNIIIGFQLAQKANNEKNLLKVLDQYPNLPWEAIPTEMHKAPEVWKKIFYNNQLNGHALLRNVLRLTRIRAFDDMVFARDFADKLIDVEMLRKTKLHPVNFLNALVTYAEGQLPRGNTPAYGYRSGYRTKDWISVPVITDALNEGFHRSFKTIESANKRTMLALDISGSMAGLALGIDLSCAQVTAAMSMVTARTEPYYTIMGFANTFRDLDISPSMNLNAVLSKVVSNNFGTTDCAMPMLHALQHRMEIDTFVLYTDNETYAGRIHPHKALEDYRQKMGRDAKLAVVGINAIDFTIANPEDKGMMDFCGFDATAPKVLADFSAGRI